jgi:hypothetical protein
MWRVESVVVGGEWNRSSSVGSGIGRRRWGVESVVVGGEWNRSSSVEDSIGGGARIGGGRRAAATVRV